MGSYQFSFTAASSDITTFKEVPVTFGDGNFAMTSLGDQVVGVSAQTTFSAGTSVITFVWVEGENAATKTTLGVTQYEDVNLTTQPRRTGLDNSSGNYVCSVAAGTSGNNKVDILGIGPLKDNINGTSYQNRRLYVGLTTIGAAGTVTVQVSTSRIT